MIGKPNNKCLGAMKAKVPNIIANIGSGHICIREENFSLTDSENFLFKLLLVK
jgi:hypothetical protein